MTTTKIGKGLLIAALLVSGLALADNTDRVAADQGGSTMQFRIGDSNCELQDDQIRCTPIGR